MVGKYDVKWAFLNVMTMIVKGTEPVCLVRPINILGVFPSVHYTRLF